VSPNDQSSREQPLPLANAEVTAGLEELADLLEAQGPTPLAYGVVQSSGSTIEGGPQE
jgi:hypothetical protein